jgi:hypothetical protein
MNWQKNFAPNKQQQRSARAEKQGLFTPVKRIDQPEDKPPPEKEKEW